MKILFFIDTLESGGKERRLTELLKALKAEPEVEFSLLVMSGDIHYKEILDLGIKIHYIVRKSKKDFSVLSKFYQLCKSIKPDVVHCWDSMTAVYSIPICKLLKIKLINGMVVDSPAKQNIFNKYWFRAKLTFPLSNMIIGNSRSGMLAYNAPKNKSLVIYNGFNFSRLETLHDKLSITQELGITTEYIIGMVASFGIYKDYKTYFEAAQILLEKRKDISFLAIGNNTDSDQASNLIETRFLPYFRLLGKKSGIESFINAMNVCVLSTFTEGISNSVLEYMALAKPVIASNGGGTNEIVVDNQTGFLINPSDPFALAEKIEVLLADSVLCEKMGLSGKQRVHEIFSIDSMVSKYISAYKNV